MISLINQAYEFFLFASLMFVDCVLLGWMATSYHYVDYTTGPELTFKMKTIKTFLSSPEFQVSSAKWLISSY